VVELWLTGDTAALARAPFDLLRVDLRQAREDRLAADPLARGAAGLLASTSLLAFLVALLALVLLVVAERRDESAQLYAWESDGVAPRTLRLTLFLRALAVTVVGVPGGILLGLLLSRITTALVLVTAVGATPVPPLVLAVTPLWTVTALVAGIAVGLGVCGALAAAALREPLPRRPEEGLV
jgi:ABC-type antimicrobial peptide transport system permease subunit